MNAARGNDPLGSECSFCAIMRGSATAEVVGSGEQWVAFLPLHPATPGHTLVVPVEHVTDYWSADPELVMALALGAAEVGRSISRALRPDGMNLITSAGEAAEQTVFHLHLHVVPRWRDDDIGPIWPPKELSDRREDPALADRIRQEFRGPRLPTASAVDPPPRR